MKRKDIKKILLLGAGPIVIGQGCEFDYSGVQAVKVLKREGYQVILVNSNPATVMTDAFKRNKEEADKVYIEPLLPEYVEKIIEKERPDALLPTLGGQTALNLAMELARSGVLKKYKVEMIGADDKAIDRAEDRDLFKKAMQELDLDMPKSGCAHDLEEVKAVAKEIGTWPLIIRPAFTLGGTGGGIAHDEKELLEIAGAGLDASLKSEVLIEESLIGWKEYEMEVMRDKAGNAVIVCSIENLDPMGVHTGDSITVAPAITLTDVEYQAMRDDSIRVLEKIGIATGGSNVQWAVDPRNGRRVIIEMNPRVSRSSALASKATGFPIAKIAALLAVGYTLDELKNDITEKTPACFEPALDYCVVKIPRFTFEKFPGAETKLGTQMHSVGEVMAIGKTFKQAYLKAVRSLEAPLAYHDEETFDPWFKNELKELKAFREFLASFTLDTIPEDVLLQAKVMGFSDKEIAHELKAEEADIRAKRKALDIHPVFGAVDTCAGEFEAKTPYYYSYYSFEKQQENPPKKTKKRIMVLGGGPNRIGQGIEFDWCCCHAAFALKEKDFEVIMQNSNPETVSTDYDTSDKLYFEPLTFEDVMEVYEKENCDGIIVQYGGQTPLNLAARLKAAGATIVGTTPEDIALAEDRDFFKQLVSDVGMKQPVSGIAHSVKDAAKIAEEIGYPVLVRPSFVLGGRGMAIVSNEKELDRYVAEAVAASEGNSILIDKFLENAVELDVDCISDGDLVVIGAILEHVEAAGCHSGDAAAITPPVSLKPQVISEIRRYAEIFAKRLRVVGLMNLQLAVKNDELWMIEVNPRASRTVPFVSKAIGAPLAGYAALCMVGYKLKDLGFTEEKAPKCYCVKEAVFPFIKFRGAAIDLTPEMRSTGEVMSLGQDPMEAYYKSQQAAGSPLPKSGKIFVSLKDEDKLDAIPLVQKLVDMGFFIYATLGTSTCLWNNGIKSTGVYRVSKGRPNAIDYIREREIGWVVNTSESGMEPADDHFRIRAEAVLAGVPVTTTIDGLRYAVAALERELGQADIPVRNL